ncbi:MAG: hypothetical protein ABEJ65_03795, partial [bacterium]
MATTIALVTGEQWKDNCTEIECLREELSNRNMDSETVVWSRGVQPLNNYDGVIIRACWDYHEQPKKFEKW